MQVQQAQTWRKAAWLMRKVAQQGLNGFSGDNKGLFVGNAHGCCSELDTSLSFHRSSHNTRKTHTLLVFIPVMLQQRSTLAFLCFIAACAPSDDGTCSLLTPQRRRLMTTENSTVYR